jgi:DNA-directed RNA polymerase specialized sigma24 family protein
MAEASSKIWNSFEQALSRIDSESVELLTRHFDGASVSQLSREKKLSEQEVEAWLKKAKRELVNQLRTGIRVRQ